MKFLHEYRSAPAIKMLAREIAEVVSRPWTIMEVCGGQTHAIVKYGLQQLLPQEIELLHGPGCPVCVTPLATIDRAIELASRRDVIFCSFGDMLRVPGSTGDLLAVRARGGDIRTVYSPLDALKVAEQNPDRQVIFFAIGFETTAPANAMAVFLASKKGIVNFSLLVSHFLVEPAITSVCSVADSRVQAFLAAGHVCAVTGYERYAGLASEYRVPIVVTGFEPLDIMQGVLLCVQQLEQGGCEVINQYSRAVNRAGNPHAQSILETVFEVADQHWRGIGTITRSGLQLRRDYSHFDAARRFALQGIPVADDSACIGGEIMQGLKKPADCPHFGRGCKPDHPLGAPMVSSEGACAAYFKYGRAREVVGG